MNSMKLRLALGLALALPLSALAHKAWLLPSQTVLSAGDDTWITVDAAMSNDLFYFNHHALALDDLVIQAPDGSTLEPQHVGEGEWRSTFDVKLGQEGTYQLAIARDGLFASYKLEGERKRWRGSAGEFAGAIPAQATNVEVVESIGRIETFVTVGAPSDKVLAAAQKGLDLAPVTHPNDLYATESAKFRLLLDGKPAAGIEVTVIPGGTRYRTSPEKITVTTADDGSFSVTWPHAGMYWLNASIEDDKTTADAANKRYASYTATFEVLPL